MNTHTVATLIGTIAGPIWQPGYICSKDVSLSTDQYPCTALTDGGKTVPPDLRYMALHLTNDGDFRHCGFLPGACIKVEREVRTATGIVIRRRWFDLDFFPSVADCLMTDEDTLGECGF